MTNPRLATRYAKSLLDLAVEQDQLEPVQADMKLMTKLLQQNPDFTAMLRSPVIAADKKDKIISAVIGNRLSRLTQLFFKLLTAKSRESNLPEIASAFTTQYNSLKNIQTVRLTTAAPVSDSVRETILEKITQSSPDTIELETATDESLIGGFKLEMGDTLIDASVQRELNDVRKQFLGNEYLHSLR